MSYLTTSSYRSHQVAARLGDGNELQLWAGHPVKIDAKGGRTKSLRGIGALGWR